MKIKTLRVGKPRKSFPGYTYILALAAVVILGITAQTVFTLSSHQVRLEREAQLLFRGTAYKKAIERYYHAGGSANYPKNLDDLLRDRRFPNKVHHIRALYPDPMNPDSDWTLIRAPGRGISGVISGSTKKPVKQANFPLGMESFEGAQSYSDWVFEYIPASRK